MRSNYWNGNAMLWLCLASLLITTMSARPKKPLEAQSAQPHEQPLFEQGKQAMRDKKYKAAADWFFEAMLSADGQAQAQAQGSGGRDEAYTGMIQAYRAVGAEEEAYVRLGYLYFRQRNIPFAKQMSETALRTNAQSAWVQMLAAEVYLSEDVLRESTEEETRERLRHLELADSLGKKDSAITFRIASVLWGLKAYPLSASYYDQAYALNRSMIDASLISIYERNMFCDVSVTNRHIYIIFSYCGLNESYSTVGGGRAKVRSRYATTHPHRALSTK